MRSLLPNGLKSAEPEGWEEQKIKDFEIIQEIVRSIRNIRAEKKVAPSKKIAANISAGTYEDIIRDQSANLCALAGIAEDQLKVFKVISKRDENQVSLVVGGIEIFLPMAGMVNRKDELLRIQKELAEVQSQIQRLENLLNSPFGSKAPEDVVGKEREKLESYKETAAKLSEQLK